MTEITLSRIGELLRSVLELLWNKPDGLPAREIIAILPEITQLSEYEKGYAPPSNIPRYERIARLATLPLVRAGWLVKNDKGRWIITEKGRIACRKFPNASELYQEASKIYEQDRQHAPAAWMALEEAQENAWDQINKFLKSKNRREFQEIVVELLKAMGYHIVWIAPLEKERGHVDIIAHVDPLGAKGGRILVQVSHKEQMISLEHLNSFVAVLGDNDFGLLISSGGYANDVKDKIETDAYHKMTLLDLEAFFDLWVTYYDQLSPEARNSLPLKPVQFLHGLD